jgi:hypothetical protein
MMTAGFRALTYPAYCDDVDRYPVYGDFSSPIFNKSVIPIIAWLAPKALFGDAKNLLRIFGAFEDGLIKRLDFDQEIVLGSGRDPIAFYRALQDRQAKVIEINLPDFAVVKRELVEEKCRRYDLAIPNLHILGMDLLKDDLFEACLQEGIDIDRNLVIYEVGLTMYLSEAQQEKLFENVDRLFRRMKGKCVLLTSTFDISQASAHRKNFSLNGLVLAIEKLFRSKIRIDNHAPDAFFSQRGYRIVKAGGKLHDQVTLDGLHGGLSITGYVWNE